MSKKLYNVSPTHSHNLAGRVVGLFRRAGVTDRPTLNRIHQITETRANDPEGLKLFLKNLVDVFTAPAPLPPATQKQRRTYEEDRNAVLEGEQIAGMFEFDASPATDLGESFTLPAYEVESSEWVSEE